MHDVNLNSRYPTFKFNSDHETEARIARELLSSADFSEIYIVHFHLFLFLDIIWAKLMEFINFIWFKKFQKDVKNC